MSYQLVDINVVNSMNYSYIMIMIHHKSYIRHKPNGCAELAQRMGLPSANGSLEKLHRLKGWKFRWKVYDDEQLTACSSRSYY